MTTRVGDSVDTILALATPAAPAARAILRMSGPRAIEIAERVLAPSPGTPGEGWGEGTPERELLAAPPTTHAPKFPLPNPLPEYRARELNLGDRVVPANVLVFHAPRTATGEDIVEFHLPGSPWLVGQALDRLFAAGARQAEPGEFTSRAFLNGKLDLASAEGVVATIGASNRAGLQAARQLLAGELSRRLQPSLDQLADALALVEIGIDFSEEDVLFIARDRLLATITALRATLQELIAHSTRFERLDHEPRIVLAGRPNAGKSSLLNALAGRGRAIVGDVAGTTRDALSERVALAGGFVTIVDIAGLESDADRSATDPSIAAQMRSAAEDEIAWADQIVLVIASDDDRAAIRLSREPDLIVRSKADLLASHSSGHGKIQATVTTNNGLEALRDALNARCFAADPIEPTGNLALNIRHRKAIGDAIIALDRAYAAVDHGAEIIAAELRAALDDLGRVLGKVAPDEVLGRIFSGFCIGK